MKVMPESKRENSQRDGQTSEYERGILGMNIKRGMKNMSQRDNPRDTHTNLVLSQQEGQQHQHASVVNHPPHIDGALPQAVLISGETVHILGHKQGLMGCCGLPHRLWMDRGRGRE